MTVYWGEKRYYSLDYYLKEHFDTKMYKIALNGGMTCPNRDGTLDSRGCIFCSEGGSGDFAGKPELPIQEQIEIGKESLRTKYTGNSFIAYFQAFTNTYGPTPYLDKIFSEAIAHPDVQVLSIATRPDCLSEETIALLARLNQKKPIWVELGLQTIHEDSASFIRRGYTLNVFNDAVVRLRAAGLTVIVHVILSLPGETYEQMLETIRYLNQMDIQGIKLQLLHVLKHTDLASYYESHPFHIPSMDEYFHILGACVNTLRPDIVIHRLTGDGAKSILIEPKWTADKRRVLNQMQAYFKKHNIWQGKEFEH